MHKDRLLLGGCVGLTTGRHEGTANGRAENNECDEEAGSQSAPDSPAVDWHEQLNSPGGEGEDVLLDELIIAEKSLVRLDSEDADDNDDPVFENESDCGDAGEGPEGLGGTDPTPDRTEPSPPCPPPQPRDGRNERCAVISPPGEILDEPSPAITAQVNSQSGPQPPSSVEGEGGLDTNAPQKQCDLSSEE